MFKLKSTSGLCPNVTCTQTRPGGPREPSFENAPPAWIESQNSFKNVCFLKVGLGISRTNADSQWNPVYNAFHQFFCCVMETIRQ